MRAARFAPALLLAPPLALHAIARAEYERILLDFLKRCGAAD